MVNLINESRVLGETLVNGTGDLLNRLDIPQAVVVFEHAGETVTNLGTACIKANPQELADRVRDTLSGINQVSSHATETMSATSSAIVQSATQMSETMNEAGCTLRRTANQTATTITNTGQTIQRTANVIAATTTITTAYGLWHVLLRNREVAAYEADVRASIENHNTQHESRFIGEQGVQRAATIIRDALGYVDFIIGMKPVLRNSQIKVLLIGDYHTGDISSWSEIQNLPPGLKANFPNKQHLCIVDTLQQAAAASKEYIDRNNSCEKCESSKPLHFIWLLASPGNATFSQIKKYHQKVVIPSSVGSAVSIVGLGGRGDQFGHSLHIGSSVETTSGGLLSLVAQEGILLHRVDVWMKDENLITRGKEWMGWPVMVQYTLDQARAKR